MSRVHIPSPLRSYTRNQATVEASAASLGGLLATLDEDYPGIRFRMIDEQDGIRPHIKLFINAEQVTRLNTPLAPDDEVHIICAISGGTGKSTVAS